MRVRLSFWDLETPLTVEKPNVLESSRAPKCGAIRCGALDAKAVEKLVPLFGGGRQGLFKECSCDCVLHNLLRCDSDIVEATRSGVPGASLLCQDLDAVAEELIEA